MDSQKYVNEDANNYTNKLKMSASRNFKLEPIPNQRANQIDMGHDPWAMAHKRCSILASGERHWKSRVWALGGLP